jgi:hypothetical protein
MAFNVMVLIFFEECTDHTGKFDPLDPWGLGHVSYECENKANHSFGFENNGQISFTLPLLNIFFYSVPFFVNILIMGLMLRLFKENFEEDFQDIRKRLLWLYVPI